jgi:hypothetical protein
MLLDVAKAFFDDAGWMCEVDDDRSMIRAFHDGDTMTFPVYVRADDERDQLVLYGVLPDPVEEEHRLDVAAFLAAANYGLNIGNWEIDLGDGEVRFRAGIDVEGGELTPRMVRSMAASCVINVDVYAPAIRAVANGSMTVAEAIADVGV